MPLCLVALRFFCIAQRNFFIPWELSTGVKKIIITMIITVVDKQPAYVVGTQPTLIQSCTVQTSIKADCWGWLNRYSQTWDLYFTSALSVFDSPTLLKWDEYSFKILSSPCTPFSTATIHWARCFSPQWQGQTEWQLQHSPQANEKYCRKSHRIVEDAIQAAVYSRHQKPVWKSSPHVQFRTTFVQMKAFPTRQTWVTPREKKRDRMRGQRARWSLAQAVLSLTGRMDDQFAQSTDFTALYSWSLRKVSMAFYCAALHKEQI